MNDEREIVMVKRLNIAYINYFNLPSYHAHSIQIMEMCNALNKYANVTLIVPFFGVHNVYPKDVFKYYGVKHFPIKRIYVPDFLFLGIRLGFASSLFMHIHMLVFSITAFFYVLLSRKRYDVVYTRNPYVAFIFSFLKTKKIIYEIHVLSDSPIYRMFERRMSRKFNVLWVFITPYLKTLYKEAFSVKHGLVLHDAVNLEKFNIKEKINLKGKVKIGYVGSLKTLGYSKGIEIVIEASKRIKDAMFYIVGAKSDDEIKEIRGKAGGENIVVIKRISPFEVPKYLKSFDILLLPLPISKFNAYYTSPLKLFEYMAARKCIIASDLPSIRSVVSDEEVLFFNPGDVEDLVEKIRYIIKHKKECEKKAENAYVLVKERYTWERRAEKILRWLYGYYK